MEIEIEEIRNIKMRREERGEIVIVMMKLEENKRRILERKKGKRCR